MKTIRYESEVMLPGEIEHELNLMRVKILDSRLEPDKIIGNIETFKGSLIRWFADKQVEVVTRRVTDDRYWKDCPVEGCRNKVCLSLASDKCFVHTKGFKWIKELHIILNNKLKAKE